MGTCPVCGGVWEPSARGLNWKYTKSHIEHESAPLSLLEGRIVSALQKHPQTREQLLAATYPDADGGPLSADKCLSVFLGRINKKLENRGLSILNIGTYGNSRYVMADKGCAR